MIAVSGATLARPTAISKVIVTYNLCRRMHHHAGTDGRRDIGSHHRRHRKSKVRKVLLDSLTKMSFSSTTFVLSPCSYGIKFSNLNLKTSRKGKKRKINLFHVLPPLYVQNKNGSRDCKSIPHLNLTFFAHYGVLSSRVANRCASNNDALCAEMSSCSNSCQTSFFRHRDTAETDVPKSDAISVSVFPAKDISHAVKIVFVLRAAHLEFLA